MSEQSPEFDASILDKLIGIRKEQAQLDEYETRAEKKKDEVDQTVYRRVVEDYTQRRAALDKEAAPLKVQAQRGYRELCALHDRTSKLHADARLAKEELEFRHTIGEFDDAKLAERLEEPNGLLAKYQAELDSLDTQKAKFLEAVPADELEKAEPVPAPVAPPAPVVPAAPPAPPVAVGGMAGFDIGQPAAPAVAGAPSPAMADRQATMLADEEADFRELPTRLGHPVAPVNPFDEASGDAMRSAVPEGPPAAPPTPPRSAFEDQAEQTMLLPEASLIGGLEGAPPVEYRLAAINCIGRADTCQVRIAHPSISRRHAMVGAARDGYSIRDLKSQNGTYVNGEPVTEQMLLNGDRIGIGDVTLVFYSGAGLAAARAKTGRR
jgi:hypothetical protein